MVFANKKVAGSVSTLCNPPYTDKPIEFWDRSAIWVSRRKLKTNTFCMIMMKNQNKKWIKRSLSDKLQTWDLFYLFLIKYDISDRNILGDFSYYHHYIRLCKFYVNLWFSQFFFLPILYCSFKTLDHNEIKPYPIIIHKLISIVSFPFVS